MPPLCLWQISRASAPEAASRTSKPRRLRQKIDQFSHHRFIIDYEDRLKFHRYTVFCIYLSAVRVDYSFRFWLICLKSFVVFRSSSTRTILHSYLDDGISRHRLG